MDDTEFGELGLEFDDGEAEDEGKSDDDQSMVARKQGSTGKPTKNNKLAVSQSPGNESSTSMLTVHLSTASE